MLVISVVAAKNILVSIGFPSESTSSHKYIGFINVANKPFAPSSSAVWAKPAIVSPKKFSNVPLVIPPSADRLAEPF